MQEPPPISRPDKTLFGSMLGHGTIKDFYQLMSVVPEDKSKCSCVRNQLYKGIVIAKYWLTVDELKIEHLCDCNFLFQIIRT